MASPPHTVSVSGINLFIAVHWEIVFIYIYRSLFVLLHAG